MLTFQKILFPVDFTNRSFKTVQYVAKIARKFYSKVILLHAVTTNRTNSREQCEFVLDHFGDGSFDGLRVERVIETGDPAEVITEYIREHGIDLVTMPTHGYSGFRRLMLGSVTTRVLHDSGCPVWTTAHCDEMEQGCAECLNRIACGVDLERDALGLVCKAKELAERYEASVCLVHSAGSDRLLESDPFQEFLIKAAVEKMSELQAQAETHFDNWIGTGDVAHVIRGAVLDFHADLALIGRGHAAKLLGSLRTSVHEIVRESPCPVLCF